MSSTLYDEEDPPPSSSSPLASSSTTPSVKDKRRSMLSKIISETFKTTTFDEESLMGGIDFEQVEEDQLRPVVESIKKRYDTNSDGDLDEGEVNKMLLDALKMGANEKNLVSENDELTQKVSKYDMCI